MPPAHRADRCAVRGHAPRACHGWDAPQSGDRTACLVETAPGGIAGAPVRRELPRRATTTRTTTSQRAQVLEHLQDWLTEPMAARGDVAQTPGTTSSSRFTATATERERPPYHQRDDRDACSLVASGSDAHRQTILRYGLRSRHGRCSPRGPVLGGSGCAGGSAGPARGARGRYLQTRSLHRQRHAAELHRQARGGGRGQGRRIRFRCGKKPITIKMWATAKVRNDAHPWCSTAAARSPSTGWANAASST